MRGLRTAVVAILAAGIGCGSLLTLDPGGGDPPASSDANGAPADPDGAFASDADASVTEGDADASASDGDASVPVDMGSLACGPGFTDSVFETECVDAVGKCHYEVNELPDGGEPCIKTDASVAGEKYCTACVAFGVGGRWNYTFKYCGCR